MDKIELQNSLSIIADQWQQLGIDFSSKNIKSFADILHARNSKTVDDLKNTFPDLEEQIRDLLDDFGFSQNFKIYNNILYGNSFIVKTTRSEYDYWQHRRKRTVQYVQIIFTIKKSKNDKKSIRLDVSESDSSFKYLMEIMEEDAIYSHSVVVFEPADF